MTRNYGKALDGGWGWMVVLAAHCMHFLVGGLDRASGVFYREILSEMRESAASTAGFSAVMFSTRYVCSPLAGVLCKYWGYRAVTVSGGLLACLGVSLSSFCRSMALINLTLGFMTGLGNGLAYTSCLLAVNDYFNNRKATALGIATAGTGVGSFVLPLLLQYLIQVYSYRGCMMILSGLSLNLVVCGALLYPLPTTPCPENEVTVLEPLKKLPAQKTVSEGRSFCAQLWANFDLKLFLNPYFVVFAAAALFISAGFKPVPVVLPHHAQLTGLESTTSVLLISVSGACDTVSRFSLGLLFDVPCLVPHRRRIWSLGMLLTAASVTAYAFMESLAPFLLVSVAFGLTTGLFVSQEFCILSDLIGRDRTRTGLGLMILCRGIGVGIGPPLVGAIKDATGSYVLSFCALGLCVLIGFLCLCTLDIAMAVCRPRAARTIDRTLEVS